MSLEPGRHKDAGTIEVPLERKEESAIAVFERLILRQGTRFRQVPDFLRAWRYRDFRLLWVGAFISFFGSWMQQVAQGSLVFDLTQNPRMLGMTSFVGSIPMLFLGPLGGLAADRLNKRHVLMVTQTTMAISALILSTLIFTHVIHVWHVMVIAAVNGVVFSIDSPVRQSLVYHLVPREDLANGIALNSATFNIARLAGPYVGGWMLQHYGAGWCFFSNGVSFAAIIIALWMLHADTKPAETTREPLWESLTTGTRYVARTPELRALVMMVAGSSVFAFCYMPLMPAVQARVFAADKAQLGLLFLAVGVGAVTGLIVLAVTSRSTRKGLATMASQFGLGLSVLAFGIALSWYDYMHADQRAWLGPWLSAHLPLLSQSAGLLTAKVALFGVGMAGVIQMAMTNTLVQTYAPEQLRGRVLAVHLWCMLGIMPFGSLWAGIAAERWGTPNTMVLGGACTMLIACCALAFGRASRSLE